MPPTLGTILRTVALSIGAAVTPTTERGCAMSDTIFGTGRTVRLSPVDRAKQALSQPANHVSVVATAAGSLSAIVALLALVLAIQSNTYKDKMETRSMIADVVSRDSLHDYQIRSQGAAISDLNRGLGDVRLDMQRDFRAFSDRLVRMETKQDYTVAILRDMRRH